MIIEVNDLPKTLDETYTYIDNMDMKDLDDWLKMEVMESLTKAHHSFGQWIRNEFQLWVTDNELKQWFIDNYFLDHPDDISSLVLINYHEKKNGRNPNLYKHANRYHKFWEKHIPNYRLKVRNHKLKKLCLELEK